VWRAVWSVESGVESSVNKIRLKQYHQMLFLDVYYYNTNTTTIPAATDNGNVHI